MRPLTLVVLASLLLFAAVAAAAPVLNTPEVPLGGVLTPDVAPLGRTSASIASNGTDFLVAWVDQRETFPTIRATRILERSELEVADPLGIVVARDENPDSYSVVAASDGRDYLLAFDCGTYTSPLICTAVVTAEGVVNRSPMTHAGTAPDLAWNGTEYLLVYRRSNFITPPEPSLFARRLTRGGAAVGAEITLGVGGVVAVASDGRDFYVVWTFSAVEGRIVRAAGPIEVRPVAVPVQSFGAGNLDVASNGTEYLVTWGEAFGAGRVEARFVNGAGEAFGATMLVAAPPEGATSPTVTWQGDRFLIAYVTRRNVVAGAAEIRAVYVTSSMAVSDEFTIVNDGRRHGAPSAATNGRTLVAWSGAEQIRVFDEESRTTQVVAFSVRWQDTPVTSPSSDHDLVVWSELAGESQTRTLYVKRAFDESPSARLHPSELPQTGAAISGGTSPMVFWLETGLSTATSTILGKRVDADGRPSGGEPVRIGVTPRSYGVSVTTIGSRHYVIWIAVSGQLMMTRVTEDGLVLDPTAIPIVTARTREVLGTPAVATDGESLLVAWNTVDPTPCNILCPISLALDVARVTVDGVPAATATLEEGGTSSAVIVWNGSEYGVFWADQGTYGLAARRFDRQGRAMDTQSRFIDSRVRVERPVIAWNGREYIEAAAPNESRPRQIIVNRISRDLRLLSTVSVQNTPEERRLPAVLLGRPDRGDFVLYGKLIQDKPYLGTSRIIIRSLTSVPRLRATRR